ncbi:hypothetical protein [Streptomyces sp. NPDC048462]|uniref:hypothetical protein n=1 Tax=Streptomyces sp. NPDC048462 TaxID=3365555 RepID=UPI0037104498
MVMLSVVRVLVRKQAGVTYDQAKARGIIEQSIRKEAAAKNRQADLINIAGQSSRI